MIAALVAVSVLILPVGSASGASGHYGTVQESWAHCENDRILVDAPIMLPASVQYGGGGFAVGGSTVPSQTVAFRANLAWWNGAQWVEYLHSNWYYQQAGYMNIGFVGYTGSWFDWNTGAVLAGMIVFQNLPNPQDYKNEYYYRVYFDYWWKNDQHRDSGGFTDWAGWHDELRGQPYPAGGVISQEHNEFCKYPGPNWLLDLN